MKTSILLAVLFGTVVAANAQSYQTNWSSGFGNGGVIPDNNLSGWSDTRTVNTAPVGTLTDLSVDLQISGGWNGDLYAYLVHDAGFSVLLDRVGAGVSGPLGYADAGMNVTLAATGANIHSYGGVLTLSAMPTGSWMADNTSGSLGSFLGTNPNGDWSLFIADMSGGSISTVQSWGLNMSIVAVPEPQAAALIGMGLTASMGIFWRRRSSRPNA